jgi:hypothetical protein
MRPYTLNFHSQAVEDIKALKKSDKLSKNANATSTY